MSKAKGGRNRRKVQKYFQSLGYIVANVERGGSRYRKERDLFALSLEGTYPDKGFDLVALGEKGSMILIQVKSNRRSNSRFYRDFAEIYATSEIEVLDAVWVDRDGLRLIFYEPDGSETELFVDSSDVL